MTGIPPSADLLELFQVQEPTMVFSSTAQEVVLGYDSDTDQTFLNAELKVDSGGSKTTGICLDDYLGISTEYKGFDTTRGQTASAQGKTLRSYLVPDGLTLKHGTVLYGKVREEYGGWETCIYLDLFFNNVSGALSREEWYVAAATRSAPPPSLALILLRYIQDKQSLEVGRPHHQGRRDDVLPSNTEREACQVPAVDCR